MAVILYHKKLSDGFFLLKAEAHARVFPGQFYMLRAWGDCPVLSRPVSVYDADGDGVTFLYKVVGKGTRIISKLKPGDDITLQGPYGNGFFDVLGDASGSIAMVGGGVGIAPFYYTAKKLKIKYPKVSVDMYLGFSGTPLLLDAFGRVSDNLVTDVGGYITDKIAPEKYGQILTCGPQAMMRALYQKCKTAGVSEKLYVSLENRMACGIGTCLVCRCRTTGGNKKTCADGPVFKGEAVFSL